MNKRTALDAAFWDAHYKNNQTGWNIGYASTPLKEYIDQLTDKNQKILIPGAGNAYEAEYLFKNGFTNVYVADISLYPLKNLQNRVPDFPEEHLLHRNFFDIQETFDLIIEQTFFCTFNPPSRKEYVNKMYDLLNPNGKLVGLFFTFPLTEEGPPYGGDKATYSNLFSSTFEIRIMEPAYNSIKPRMGNELFFIMQKK